MNVTWWGHSSVTLDDGGRRILSDPVLTRRAAHLGRVDATAPPHDAAVADLVLVSHLHADHLHLPSLSLLSPGTGLVVPRGGARLVAKAIPQLRTGLEEIAPGEVLEVAGVRIEAVAAAHDGRRLPGSRHRGPALGYLIGPVGQQVWFAGDTGLFEEMAALPRPVLALLPVGGWGPTLGPHHLDPTGAVEAVRRVRPAAVVPIHFATLWPIGLRRAAPSTFRRLCIEPGPRFAAELAGRIPEVKTHLLVPGGTTTIAASLT